MQEKVGKWERLSQALAPKGKSLGHAEGALLGHAEGALQPPGKVARPLQERRPGVFGVAEFSAARIVSACSIEVSQGIRSGVFGVFLDFSHLV